MDIEIIGRPGTNRATGAPLRSLLALTAAAWLRPVECIAAYAVTRPCDRAAFPVPSRLEVSQKQDGMSVEVEVAVDAYVDQTRALAATPAPAPSREAAALAPASVQVSVDAYLSRAETAAAAPALAPEKGAAAPPPAPQEAAALAPAPREGRAGSAAEESGKGPRADSSAPSPRRRQRREAGDGTRKGRRRRRKKAKPPEAADEGHVPGSGVTTAGFFQGLSKSQSADASCLAGIGEEGGLQFGRPRKGLESHMSASSRLFLIGDSVIGQLCALGSPGLCCSNDRPCAGTGPYPGGEWEATLHEKDAGWQHHAKFKVRTADNRGWGEAYLLAPEVRETDGDSIAAAAGLLQRTLAEAAPTGEDVMVLGMIGNHFNKFLTAFEAGRRTDRSSRHVSPIEKYVGLLMRDVVNAFPGRVVLLGYSPQHFAGTGTWDGETKPCTPLPQPGELAAPMNSLRKSIFLHETWRNLKHPRARIVDVYQMLISLWSCHRSHGDCTHWRDSVITLQAQLVLDALERLGGGAE